MSQQFLPPRNKYTGSFTEDTEGDGVRLNAFNHEDADVAFDPLSAKGEQPGLVDGHGAGAPIWPGTTEFLHYHEQPGVCSFETVLQGGGRRIADGVRPFTRDIDPAQVVTHTDAGGGGWLRRRFFGRQFDAAVAASRHTRGDISGGVVYGPGDAGRCFPHSHSSSGDTSKSPPTTSRGRSIRGLHTTTC